MVKNGVALCTECHMKVEADPSKKVFLDDLLTWRSPEHWKFHNEYKSKASRNVDGLKDYELKEVRKCLKEFLCSH